MGRGVPSSGGFGGGGFSGGGSRSNSGGGGGLWNWVLPAMIISKTSNNGNGGSVNAVRPEKQHPERYMKKRNKVATYIIAGMFLILSAIIITCAALTVYKPTKAIAVDYDYKNGLYYYTYVFEVDDTFYTVISQEGWYNASLSEVQASLDKVYDIYYQKNNPYKIIEAEFIDDYGGANNIGPIMIGAFFGIIALIIAGVGINKYVLRPEYINYKEEVVPEGKVKCVYCGTLVNKESNKCDSCGAGLNAHKK